MGLNANNNSGKKAMPDFTGGCNGDGCINELEKLSEVQEFYKKKNVLITGATGFLGKVLMEKLLRSCQGLDNLYILVRQKRGKDIYTRMEEVFDNPLFDRLKEEVPKFRHKVVIIQGDFEADGLGLTINDRQMLLEKVNVIFHSAATVKFDEHLRIALATNVRATLSLLNIAKQMKNLSTFMHVSTAFSNPFRDPIDEKCYPCNMNYEDLQKIVDLMTDSEVDKLTEMLMDSKWPNTYTYTKALTENELLKNYEHIPLCIFRPAIVTSTAEAPIKGWVDNMNGATGVVVGCMTGILRTAQCDPNVNAEIVPVDYVVNCLMVASLHVHKLYKKSPPPSEPPIFNYVTSLDNKLTWHDFKVLSFKTIDIYPTSSATWYRTLTLNKNYYINQIYTVFLHLLPALLVDGVEICLRKKTKMLNVYRKIHKFSSTISYFSVGDFNFRNERTKELWNQTSHLDKQIFPFDMSHLDWINYFQEYILGIRRYLLRDKDETLTQARIKSKSPPPSEPPIFNYVTSLDNKLTWHDFKVLSFKTIDIYPTSSATWYRTLTLNKNYYINQIYTVFLHLLPALLVDGVEICLRKKTKMLNVYRKIHKFSSTISYFSVGDFNFRNERTKELWNQTSHLDKQIFPFDMSHLDWINYFQEYILGIRRYLLRDKDETLTQARIKSKRLYYVHQIVCFVCLFFALYTVGSVIVSAVM